MIIVKELLNKAYYREYVASGILESYCNVNQHKHNVKCIVQILEDELFFNRFIVYVRIESIKGFNKYCHITGVNAGILDKVVWKALDTLYEELNSVEGVEK